jgi:hypothetical protein
MKNKELILLLSIFLIAGCNNNDTKVADKKPLSDSVSIDNSNLFSADINGIKTIDKSPLILFKKNSADKKESMSISSVFNDINSHIGLLLVKDTGILSPGKYLLQQKDDKKTNGRYETNINGGTTKIENSLYKTTGTVNIIIFDTATKKIEADIEMDAVNIIQQKVHITAHVSSNYKQQTF